MSSYTKGTTAITLVRGRPQIVPMRWQAPSGAPIDVTGFVFTARVAWKGSPPRWPAASTAVPVAVTDMASGAFELAVPALPELPLGRLYSEIRLSITDAAGGHHVVAIPVTGVEA